MGSPLLFWNNYRNKTFFNLKVVFIGKELFSFETVWEDSYRTGAFRCVDRRRIFRSCF